MDLPENPIMFGSVSSSEEGTFCFRDQGESSIKTVDLTESLTIFDYWVWILFVIFLIMIMICIKIVVDQITIKSIIWNILRVTLKQPIVISTPLIVKYLWFLLISFSLFIFIAYSCSFSTNFVVQIPKFVISTLQHLANSNKKPIFLIGNPVTNYFKYAKKINLQ